MGAGPAALCIVAELVEQGLEVKALASHPPDEPWPNTYGIWAEEVDELEGQMSDHLNIFHLKGSALTADPKQVSKCHEYHFGLEGSKPDHH